MRRLILEEPYSAAALWSRRLALFALAVAAISIALARSRIVDVSAVLAVFGGSIVMACLALLSAGAGSVVIWRTGRRGAGKIVGGIMHPPIPPDWREAQRRAYTDVQPIVLDLEAEEAWQIVQKAVAARNWQIVDQVLPGGRSGIGHVDAVDRSLIMGFPEDVTVRLRPLAGQTRIDVRSASRFGRHDFGANARRIQRFAQELQTQLDAR